VKQKKTDKKSSKAESKDKELQQELLAEEKRKAKVAKVRKDLAAQSERIIELEQGKKTNPQIVIIYIIAAVIAALLVILVFLSFQPRETIMINQVVESNRTENITVPLDVSIAKYSGITNRKYEENISIIAHLKHEEIIADINATHVFRYIVDDDSNSIRINLGLHSYNYEPLFERNNVTKSYFQVTGLLYFFKDTLLMDVDSITNATMPTTIKENIIEEEKNVTQTIDIGARFNITYGFNKIIGLFKKSI